MSTRGWTCRHCRFSRGHVLSLSSEHGEPSLGALQRIFFQKSEITTSRSHSEFFLENCPKIALNQYWYFRVVYHVYSVCTYIAKSCWLLWFECSVHVSDWFPKKSLDGGWVGGWVFAKPLSYLSTCSLGRSGNCHSPVLAIENVDVHQPILLDISFDCVHIS